MNAMRAIIAAEARLLLREPISWVVSIILPSGILLVFGLLVPQRADPAFGGLRFIDVFAPSLAVISTATLALQFLPIRLATYREKGILRRFSTTPVPPSRLLVAQLVVYSVMATVGLVLLVIVGYLAFGIRLPGNPLGYMAAFGIGMAGLLAVGLLVAAVTPSAGVGEAIALPIFFAVMLLGGVYYPRTLLPEPLIRVGEFTPPGVQGLQDAWLGVAPQVLPLAALAALAVVVGAISSRMFRWE
jgi:ABC-2 type transport system permease protein